MGCAVENWRAAASVARAGDVDDVGETAPLAGEIAMGAVRAVLLVSSGPFGDRGGEAGEVESGL